MGHITTENAQQELERLQKEMREETSAYVAGLSAPTDPEGEGQPAGAETVTPPEPENPPEKGTQTPEGETSTPKPEKPSPEPKPEENAAGKTGENPDAAPAAQGHPESNLADLKAQFERLEKNYKAIQSAITPTQQQRAALRKENEALRKELEALKGGSQEASLKEQLEHLEGVLPEGRAALEQIIDRQDRLDAQFQDAETRRKEAIAKSTWDSIVAARPNVSEYSKPEHPLWTWIDQQPEGALYREVLAAPAEFQNGSSAFNAILDAFEAQTQARPAVIATPTPIPTPPQSRSTSAPAVPAPKPTDVGAPTRTAPPSRPASTVQRTREFTDADYASMERELRTAKPERALEIVQLLRKR